MTREKVFEMIMNFNGPIGPLGNSLDETERQQNLWIKTYGEEIIDPLVDLITNPPDEAQFNHPAHIELFNVGTWEIVQKLATEGWADNILSKLQPALQNPTTQQNAIVIIGQLGSAKGLSVLKSLTSSDHNEVTWSYLIGAIAEIGEKQGLDILGEIESKVSQKYPTLVQDIRNAENIISGSA